MEKNNEKNEDKAPKNKFTEEEKKELLKKEAERLKDKLVDMDDDEADDFYDTRGI